MLVDKTRITVGQIARVRAAETDNFVELVTIAGLNPANSFRFMNLNKADFSSCDLNGFDFSRAILDEANFVGAKIKGSILNFRQLTLPNLTMAADYNHIFDTRPEKWSGNVNEADAMGVTALMAACGNGNVELVRWLLEHPTIDLKLVDVDDETRNIAAITGLKNSHIAALLLGHTRLEISNSGDVFSALAFAASNGWLEVLEQILIKKGHFFKPTFADADRLISKAISGMRGVVPYRLGGVEESRLEEVYARIWRTIQICKRIYLFCKIDGQIVRTREKNGSYSIGCNLREGGRDKSLAVICNTGVGNVRLIEPLIPVSIEIFPDDPSRPWGLWQELPDHKRPAADSPKDQTTSSYDSLAYFRKIHGTSLGADKGGPARSKSRKDKV